MISEHETLHEALDNLLYVYSANKTECPAVQRVIDAKWRLGFDIRSLPNNDALDAVVQAHGGDIVKTSVGAIYEIDRDAFRSIVMDLRVKQPTADLTDLDILKLSMSIGAYLNTLDQTGTTVGASYHSDHNTARDELASFCQYVTANRRILTTKEKERAQSNI